jgi:hypothetical protein
MRYLSTHFLIESIFMTPLSSFPTQVLSEIEALDIFPSDLSKLIVEYTALGLNPIKT